MTKTHDITGQRFGRLTAILLVAGFVTGCVSSQATYQKYVGGSVVAIVTNNGPPASSFATGDGRQAFQWAWSGAAVSTFGGGMMVTTQGRCLATFYAKRTGTGTGYADYTVVGFAKPSMNC
jgi:hypothetical protein